MYKIQVDDRENIEMKLFDLIDPVVNTIAVESKRLEVGDYAIWYEDILLLLIERKIWSDLAASIKDDRLESQVKSLVEMAAKGAKPVILIEGRKGREHGHIPIENLEAKLDHIMIRNDIQIIFTADESDTVRRLYQLTSNYPMDMIIKRGGEAPVKIEKKKATMEDIAVGCLSEARGIQPKTALLILSRWSIYDVFEGKVTIKELSTMKYATSGHEVGDKVAKKIVATLKSSQAKILAGINGITMETAAKILSLADWTEQEIGNILIGKKRLGSTIASRVISVCDYKA